MILFKFRDEFEKYPQRSPQEHFCLLPRVTEKGIVWLQYIYKQRREFTDGYCNFWGWHYFIEDRQSRKDD